MPRINNLDINRRDDVLNAAGGLTDLLDRLNKSQSIPAEAAPSGKLSNDVAPLKPNL